MTAESALVAAYLRHVRECDVVLTDVPLTDGVGPLDALGLALDGELSVVWLCATNLDGVAERLRRAVSFSGIAFDGAVPRAEVWVPGLAPELDDMGDLPLAVVAGEDFDARVREILDVARRAPADATADDTTFRLLQLVAAAVRR